MKPKLILVIFLVLLGGSLLWPLSVNVVFADNAGRNSGLEKITTNLNDGTIAAYHKLEFHLKISGNFQNPYDPDEIAVDAVFTGPDGHESRVPGFYYQPFTREIDTDNGRENILPDGEPDWCLRFTPGKPGDWSYRLLITRKGRTVETERFAFRATAENHHGFVRVDPMGSGYFVFDDGRIYLPIGSNVAWYDGRGMMAYDTWFAKMAENGANFGRVWLATWGFAPEWYDTGLGNYSARQNRAWQLDYLFELAERKNIYLMLCFLNHGQFSSGTDPEWDKNPYNIANGGFLKEPGEFYSDPKARKLFKQKLRYIAARWGYSTHLFAWEWWNEVNLTDGLGDEKALTPWLDEMYGYLKPLDPYHHLVTNSHSSSSRGNESYWNAGGIGLVQIHKYNLIDWAEFMSTNIVEMRQYTKKPILYGEYGLQQGCTIDVNGVHFHEGLWGGVFSGSSGTGMLWFWDQYIEKFNLYYHFSGISKFFAGEELQHDELHPVTLESSTAKVEGYGLAGTGKALIWIKSLNYSYREVENLALKYGIGKRVVFPEVKKAKVTILSLTPGTYRIERWDTVTGKILSQKKTRIPPTGLVLELPSFKQDLAFKIVKE
jgi:hypothetical protein